MSIDIKAAIAHKCVEAIQLNRFAINGDDWCLTSLNPLAASRQQCLHGIGGKA